MAAKHDYELRADSFTHLHLDSEHMGVGGDDSWSPSCHQVLAWSCFYPDASTLIFRL
jgi:beta-galactosidase